jgi:hypothetical protein
VDDASLSELQLDVMYDYVWVSLMLVTCVLYGALMSYGVSNFLVYGLCIYVRLMSLCVPQCIDYVLDNLWCSNSKNTCVPMFLPILYSVFHSFSSILLIVHAQSIYNVTKPLTTICMIFIDFLRFFWHWKPQNRWQLFWSKPLQ